MSILRGNDGAEIIAANLKAAVSEIVPHCNRLIERAKIRQENLKLNLRQIEEDIEAACRSVVEDQLPASRFLRLMNKMLVEKQFRPIRAAVDGFTAVKANLTKRVGWLSKSDDSDQTMHNREELEKARLEQITKEVVENKWPGKFPQEYRIGGMLDCGRTAYLRDQFRKVALPEPSNDWEEGMQDAIQSWIRAHPRRAMVMANMPVVSNAVALGAVAADLVVTGGVVGSLGAIAGGGVAAGVGNWFLNKLLKEDLAIVADEAAAQWSKQRSVELAVHMQRWFAQRLFEQWIRAADVFDANLEPCQQAVEELNQMAGN